MQNKQLFPHMPKKKEQQHIAKYKWLEKYFHEKKNVKYTTRSQSKIQMKIPMKYVNKT